MKAFPTSYYYIDYPQFNCNYKLNQHQAMRFIPLLIFFQLTISALSQNHKIVATVSSLGGNLRAAPHYDSALVLRLKRGDTVYVGGDFIYPYFEAQHPQFSETLYISASSLKMTGEVMKVRSSAIEKAMEKLTSYTITEGYDKMKLRLRSTPFPTKKFIVNIPRNALLRIISYREGYWEVEYKNHVGYISEMFVLENHLMNELKPKVRQYSVKQLRSRRYIRGPRGGCYYINSNKNKVYVDRSLCR